MTIRSPNEQNETSQRGSLSMRLVQLKGRRILDGTIDTLSKESVGRKAYYIWKLCRNGYPVPRSLILSVDAYQAHIAKLGLGKKISQILNDTYSKETELILNYIRKTIQTSEVDSFLLEQIRGYFGDFDTGVAVRSSAILEDSARESAAGIFSTTLNCCTLECVGEAILQCWSSLWTSTAFRYQTRITFDQSKFNMGIIIMEMVDSSTSGVLFTQNPLTGQNYYVIESVYGLGKGLVSNELPPDRLVLNAAGRIESRYIARKEYSYVLCPYKAGGIERMPVSQEMQHKSTISDEQAKSLVSLGDRAADLFGKPVDIEWAIDREGKPWILQCRGITTTSIPLPVFSAPGPGHWKVIDHIAKPGTRCFYAYYYVPMAEGWNKDARRIGLINRVDIREVNGFMYYKMTTLESADEIAEMCRLNERYWEDKEFLSALKEWENVTKPRCIATLSALESVSLKELTDDELIDHLKACFEATKDMVLIHHSYTYTAFTPLGDFIRQVCDWTSLQPADVLSVVIGCDPNRLAMSTRTEEFDRILRELSVDIEAINLLTRAENEPQTAWFQLRKLMSMGRGIGAALKRVFDHFCFKIIDGYDITSETYGERPDLVLKTIKSLVVGDVMRASDNGLAEIVTVRQKVPQENREKFDNMIEYVRLMERLRGERGFFSDLWAIGILRHAFLETGRRLLERGALLSRSLVLDATVDEATSLLNKEKTISEEELIRRKEYRRLYSVADTPAILGESMPPIPDLSLLPESMARSMTGLMTAISLAVDHIRLQSDAGNVLKGVPASPGICEGPVRIVQSQSELPHIQRGDILVMSQATASLDGLVPCIGGLISQYGGILSHPAILAREYGIPCVVGCADALKKLQPGWFVKVNGGSGAIEIVNRHHELQSDELQGLVCEYTGAMRGRNRLRTYNHLPSVSQRLKLVQTVRKDAKCLRILEEHFERRLSSEHARDQLASRLNSMDISAESGSLDEFLMRANIEFHPTDLCNQECQSCTYSSGRTKGDAVPATFPFHGVSTLLHTFQPRAITVVGGGEPTMYNSEGRALGDLIVALSKGTGSCTSDVGLISNGVLLPSGDPSWAEKTKWIRLSLDYGNAESYQIHKGKDYFNNVVNNTFKVLEKTDIPLVGIGFLYHPGNIYECGQTIAYFARRIAKEAPQEADRFNIQFRPWRPPTGRPSVKEQILSKCDAEKGYHSLMKHLDGDGYLMRFAREHTNIAVNLLCRGARENASPFDECYFGLAKLAVRADGSVYPCFRMAAQRDMRFFCGNILTDSAESISLRFLYVLAYSAKEICVPTFDQCLFCVFNNLLQQGLVENAQVPSALADDYFF